MFKQQPNPDVGEVAPEGLYSVCETFVSTQGEGVLSGVVMVFIRLAKCNLRCSRANTGFDCDTDFHAGRLMSAQQIADEARALSPRGAWVLLTGGEPTIQADEALIDALRSAGFKIAMESNGTLRLRYEVDHLTISPKSAWHTIHQRRCHELRVVRSARQALPTGEQIRDELLIEADQLVVSPGFLASGDLDPEALAWCEQLVIKQPEWRLSVQLHKLRGVR